MTKVLGQTGSVCYTDHFHTTDEAMDNVFVLEK